MYSLHARRVGNKEHDITSVSENPPIEDKAVNRTMNIKKAPRLCHLGKKF